MAGLRWVEAARVCDELDGLLAEVRRERQGLRPLQGHLEQVRRVWEAEAKVVKFLKMEGRGSIRVERDLGVQITELMME